MWVAHPVMVSPINIAVANRNACRIACLESVSEYRQPVRNRCRQIRGAFLKKRATELVRRVGFPLVAEIFRTRPLNATSACLLASAPGRRKTDGRLDHYLRFHSVDAMDVQSRGLPVSIVRQ